MDCQETKLNYIQIRVLWLFMRKACQLHLECGNAKAHSLPTAPGAHTAYTCPANTANMEQIAIRELVLVKAIMVVCPMFRFNAARRR